MTDTVALLPWAVVLSAIAGLFAWRAWKAGDNRAVVRRVGWALVPWALWLVGGLRLAVRITDAVVDWAAGFVFRPSVWLGIAVAVVALALIVIGSRGKRSTAADRSAKDAKPALGSSPGASAGGKRSAGGPKGGAQDDDLAEIEDILRRHGIE